MPIPLMTACRCPFFGLECRCIDSVRSAIAQGTKASSPDRILRAAMIGVDLAISIRYPIYTFQYDDLGHGP